MSGWFGTAECRQVRNLRATGVYVTSRVRCAARYAALTGCSIADAALAFGINPGAVWHAWSRIYPGVSHPVSLLRRRSPECAVCGRRGHLAVHGRCSPSQLALQLVGAGATVIDAANRFGLTTHAVYSAINQRRKAA